MATGTPQKSAVGKTLSKEEQEIVDTLAKDKGEPLTPEEIHLALEQARHIGYLPETD